MSKSDQPKGGAVRKRQKIQDSAKQMFIWVAGMSAVIGAALVVSWFLWNQIAFKTKVIGAKHDTIAILKANNEAAPRLRENIRVLETNTSLADAKADDDQRALQVVLDALPADGNSLALGASLQYRLARGISGLEIESLSVAPSSSEVAMVDDLGAPPVEVEDGTVTQELIELRMQVTSRDANGLNELLRRLERSIRVVDVERLTMDRSEREYSMTIIAHGYYQPGRTLELGSKVVNP